MFLSCEESLTLWGTPGSSTIRPLSVPEAVSKTQSLILLSPGPTGLCGSQVPCLGWVHSIFPRVHGTVIPNAFRMPGTRHAWPDSHLLVPGSFSLSSRLLSCTFTRSFEIHSHSSQHTPSLSLPTGMAKKICCGKRGGEQTTVSSI